MRKLLLGLVAAFMLVGCGDDSSPKVVETSSASKASITGDKIEHYKVGDKITLKSTMNQEVTLIRTEKGFKIDGEDKILMIDIFGTFCEPCQSEAPHLMDFQLNTKDDFLMVGLIHFEDVTDEYIIDNFMKKFNAYYFIANSDKNPNEKIIEQILSDLNYRKSLTVPFKVVYNTKGEPEKLSSISNPAGLYYYNGAISTMVLKEDYTRIKNAGN
ncbi:MAG: TlpA family protein disulfide reductase [Campylobacteraceae bacterium]|nr:TlpA family protein disulfide reductase [Campylobacteraceae bacterium]